MKSIPLKVLLYTLWLLELVKSIEKTKSLTMWYLLFCEKDNSFSKVTETSVMNVGGSLELDDIVTFFYSNASHLGKIVSIDGKLRIILKLN